MYENETVLLRRFASEGDAEAFSEIVKRYADMVYGAAIRILADADTAADATQETFFHLLQNASTVTGSVSGWLHRVATRKAIDRIRRDSSRRRREAGYAAGKTVKTEKWRDISPIVDEAMDELEDETRFVLVEHFLNGRTMTQVADSLNLSQPTVSRRIENGIERLRGKLKHRGVITAAAALSALLNANAVEAAPAIVLTELGKMAIVSGVSATGVTSVSLGAKAATTVAASGMIKAKIIATAAAVVIAGTGAVITYNHVTNGEKPAENTGIVAQDDSRQDPTKPLPTDAKEAFADEMSKEEFEKQFFGDLLNEKAGDSLDESQFTGNAVMRETQIEDVSPTGGKSPTTSNSGQGSTPTEVRGGMFVPRYDTPEATISTFVTVLSTGNIDLVSRCFVEGADDIEDLRRTIEAPEDAEDVQMKELLQSIGTPVEIVKTVEEHNGLGVTWLSTVKAEFTLGDMTFMPGDKFELDATMVRVGNKWKIAGM